MSSHRSLYDVLGVTQDASTDEVRKAYKRRVLETHPDKLPPDAPFTQKQESETQFREVYDAFAILSDPVKRQIYDTKLHNQQQHSSSQPESSSHRSHPRSPSRRRRRKSGAERDRLQRRWENYHHNYMEYRRLSEQWHEQWKEWYAPWQDARAQREAWRERSSKLHGSTGRERASNDSEQTP